MIQSNSTKEDLEQFHNSIMELIKDYKKLIAQTQLKDEVYKWELLSQYGGRPNLDAPDFYQEIKEVKFGNLLYNLATAVLNHIAKDKPEELRLLFINLYDESKDLTERVKSFNRETLKLYRSLGETLSHHQDERSISTYLTFHNPQKYTFYKHGFYKNYCKLLGIKEAKKNEKFTHYLTLVNQFIEKYVEPDTELINQVKAIIPNFYDGTNHKLLVQDIFYQMLDKETNTNYWVFQGNPKVFDFETALQNNLVTDWTVTAHKDKIKIGDKIILWITGPKSGCYALAEITSKPHKKLSSPDDHLWKEEDKNELKASIKITHNLVDNPIFKSEIEVIKELNKLKIGNQGTNFSATKKEYEAMLDLSNNNSITNKHQEQMNFALNTIFYGPPGTGKTYNTVLRAAEIVENRKIDSYDEALKIFNGNLHNQIEFITFHQNYSYEDFIQGLRPDTENEKELVFERKDGVFKIIADKALKNILASKQPSITAKKSFEETFNEFINPLVEGEVEEIEVQMKRVSYFITAITNKSIEFRKTSGGTEHSLSITTLKKMYDAESVLDIQGLSSYYSPLLKELLEIGKDSSGKREVVPRKNYVIIIDEINRANISRVFGELITLIEQDKRSHGAIPMEAKLPSGDTFIVPSNLYIIGTMNTADKSIALLDIALRRRFDFEAMYPLYEIESQDIYDVDILKKLNEQIIKSKGHDFQIGHSYFMNDNKSLKERMNKKVIPLLLEYYMNDQKEVTNILQIAGLKIEENSWPLRITGRND